MANMENAPPSDALGVLEFWFADACDTPEAARARSRVWFRASPDLDREIDQRWSALAHMAADGGLGAWSSTARGALAHVIVLDQFPRNLHRGTPAAFASDARALGVAVAAIEAEFDRLLHPVERAFLYMPMQHAEDVEVQARGVRHYRDLVNEAQGEWRQALRSFLDAAVEHHEIVARFGRFPHRNAIVDRPSTAEERDYLAAGAPSFGQNSGAGR